MAWHPDKDLETIRDLFPVLKHSVYLISNSLGAVPGGVCEDLERYFTLWAEQGVSAWRTEWWDLSRRIGDQAAELIGAGRDQVTMLTHATQAHWVALSTMFASRGESRTRIVMTDHDFPSSIYAVSRIARSMGWEIDMVTSGSGPGLDPQTIIDRIDERTLFVATSHVYFKSAFIQDIAVIAERARRAGALTIIDGYHAPGTIPVNVSRLGVDFYIGGCLKWLCGGPGNAFLYANPETAGRLEPALTGWLAHRAPFRFETEMSLGEGAYRFMSGTPPVACLYTAERGMRVIRDIGAEAIRRKSLRLTGSILRSASDRGFGIHTPLEEERRGGAVSLAIPHAYQIKQALGAMKIKVDFRCGLEGEPDVIRVGPHFYTTEAEIETLFSAIDELMETDAYRSFPDEPEHVT